MRSGSIEMHKKNSALSRYVVPGFRSARLLQENDSPRLLSSRSWQQTDLLKLELLHPTCSVGSELQDICRVLCKASERSRDLALCDLHAFSRGQICTKRTMNRYLKSA